MGISRKNDGCLQNALIHLAHGDMAIGIGVSPMNKIGAMHRFDAFSGSRLLKRRRKNITCSLQMRPAWASKRYNSFGRMDLNKSDFSRVIFIALNNAELGI